MNMNKRRWLAAALLALGMAACGGGDGPGPLPPLPPSSARAITALSIGGVNGVINGTNKTVTVTLPLGTDLTSLAPAITHDGKTISPASGAAQNFYQSGFTPVTYTVTAADGS
ncbi:MAG: DUF5018 domain-containing protein, partial [Treponema sp.]|nr:DUF5018 domain-containing protein [Treponema sp.]